MRLTKQLLRSKTTEKLSTVHHLDLSNLDLVSIEQLVCCPKLRRLSLHGNSLQSLTNLDCCRQLWNLDVSNNKLGCLGGLSRFVALGSLVLANNDLSWHELAKIRHIHILELTLSGNPRLQKEPYYRLHVIDSLPHVWMLDGKMITSAERLQVKHFFQDSALTNHPIRHKLPRHRFTPTSLKNISVTGIYGEKATHLLRRFPTEGSINVETDRLRVMYMAYNLQQELLQQKDIKRISSLFRYHPMFLESILADRPQKLEQCNMLLLLLVASLEFSLPTKLMKETLITSKLDNIGGVHTMDLFLLPRELRCHILTILMNMAKVDKDKGQNGGLYNALYHCLGYTVSELNKLRYSKQTEPVTLTTTLKNYKTLLASEVVQLLCVVPGFFQYLDKDQGVMDLLTTATNNQGITEEILKLAKTSKAQGSTIKEIYDEVADYIVQKVDEQLNNIVNNKPKLNAEEQILDHVRALPMKKPTAVALAEYHAAGQQAPKHDSRLVLCSRQDAKDKSIFPHLGDRLILGPQTVAKIVSLPQPFLALVLMDTVPDVNGAMVTNVKKAEIHYTYVNMNEFRWDYIHSIWQPKGTVGDRITIRVENQTAEWERAGLTPSQSGRPNSPVTALTSPCRSPRSTSRDRISPRKHKSADTPRPMSAVLKEKLKLNLDMTKRPKTAMMIPAHHTLDIRGESMTVVSRGKVSDRPATAQPLSPEKAFEKAKYEVLQTEKTEVPEKTEETDGIALESDQTVTKHIKEIRIVTPAEMETTVESTNEAVNEVVDNLLNELADVVSISSELSCGEDPELKNLAESVATEEDFEATSPLPPVGGSAAQPQGEVTPQLSTHSVNKANSSTSQQLEISVPRVDVNESLNTSKDDSVTKEETKEEIVEEKPEKLPLKPIIKKPSERSRSCLEARPITAVEAYRFVVQHPLKGYRPPHASTRQKSAPLERRGKTPHGSGAKTRRAWREFEEEIISPGRTVSGKCVTSSRVNGKTPSRGFKITPTCTWLGGGRDIHADMMKKRPKSCHVPGWKEGLPKKPRHPSTAVGTQTSETWDSLPAWTPTYLSNYNSLLGDNSPRDSLQLPDLPSLSDYLTSVRESQTTS